MLVTGIIFKIALLVLVIRVVAWLVNRGGAWYRRLAFVFFFGVSSASATDGLIEWDVTVIMHGPGCVSTSPFGGGFCRPPETTGCNPWGETFSASTGGPCSMLAGLAINFYYNPGGGSWVGIGSVDVSGDFDLAACNAGGGGYNTTGSGTLEYWAPGCEPSPTPTPSPTPSPTPTPTPTATPTPTVEPGGDPDPGVPPTTSPPPDPSPPPYVTPTPPTGEPTPPGGSADGYHVWVDNLGEGVPEPVEFPTADLGSTPDAMAAWERVKERITDGTNGVESGMNSISVACWESASFGTATSISLGVGSETLGIPSSFPIPAWAAGVRSIELFLVTAMFFIIAVKSVLGLRVGGGGQ